MFFPLLYIFSSWLVAFSFAFEVLSIPLTSLTVCNDNHDCLSSTEFLIFISSLECILVVLFGVCLLSLGFLKFLDIDICCVSFIK